MRSGLTAAEIPKLNDALGCRGPSAGEPVWALGGITILASPAGIKSCLACTMLVVLMLFSSYGSGFASFNDPARSQPVYCNNWVLVRKVLIVDLMFIKETVPAYIFQNDSCGSLSMRSQFPALSKKRVTLMFPASRHGG